MTQKLSVMIGNQPTGLGDFLSDCRPAVIYSLNNSPKADIDKYSPDTKIVRRIQNDVWGRLPDAMSTTDYFLHQDPAASARHELLEKTIGVQKIGRLNLIQYWKLGYADWYAPMVEPDLGQGQESPLKAQWLNAWFMEAITIAAGAGLKLAAYSFATRNPRLDLITLLANSARLLVQTGGIIDTHEYGYAAGLMTPGNDDSGAGYYRQIRNALPADARPDMIVSECGWGNGFTLRQSGSTFIDDLMAYRTAFLDVDQWMLGACAFQLDQGKESCIDLKTMQLYGRHAAIVTSPPPPPATYNYAISTTDPDSAMAINAVVRPLAAEGKITLRMWQS